MLYDSSHHHTTSSLMRPTTIDIYNNNSLQSKPTFDCYMMPARTISPVMASEATAPASPSSKPPIADAPGPRAQALCNAFEKALDNTLRRCSYENFAACFPTPAEYRSETLDAFWRDFVGRLDAFCKVCLPPSTMMTPCKALSQTANTTLDTETDVP